MKKGVIRAISNTPDAAIYLFSPGDRTLKLLDEIFHLIDDCEYELGTMKGNPEKYNYYVKNANSLFRVHNDEVIAYFSFNVDGVQLILRKAKKWKKYNIEVSKRFEFTEYEWKKSGEKYRKIKVKRK